MLREFLETTINLAELVVYIAMFDYALGKISEGTKGEGSAGNEGGSGRMAVEETVTMGQTASA